MNLLLLKSNLDYVFNYEDLNSWEVFRENA